jgi:glycosyltransferase involved in cell wall biosynthesis
MFENFGTRVERTAACHKLGLDPTTRYTLFFGLIRDYKGLDTLLKAWREFRHEGHKLLIAGEFYASRDKYMQLISDLGIEDDIILHDFFARDEDVKYYFSAADALVLPYKTATQSGVTQIAYNFCTPMIVTEVGGLPEIVPNDVVGYVCPATVNGVAESIENLYKDDNLGRFRENIVEERKRFSWSAMCDKITEVLKLAKNE